MLVLRKQNFEKNKILYNKVENDLRIRLNKLVSIEHVGSTAIPDMYGKDIIDVLVGVKDDIQFKYVKGVLIDMGYVCSGKNVDSIYQFFSSTTEETGFGDIHVHLVMENTDRFSEFLILKYYLLNNPAEAKKYSDFKIKILKNGVFDRREYKKIKSEYVNDLLEKAKDILFE